MKNLFPGYYRKTEEEIKVLWENGLIVFDTNVLLNLYRYSDSTKDTLLDLINKFSNKIWLPYQAALEYNRNRFEVISDQEKAYKEFLNKIQQIQTDLQSTNKPPFLSLNVDNELNLTFEKVNTEVQDSIKKYSEYLKDDPIYNRIAKLFENKIGKNYSGEELALIYKEGEERFKNKVPPGFEDEKNKDGIRKYGDLVLWKEIIDQARNIQKAIILVTDERKKDWWWNIKDGRLMGPRHELIEEIMREAKVDFHMYSSERFLSYGQDFLKEQVSQQAVEEIQALKVSEKNKDEKNYFISKKSKSDAEVSTRRQSIVKEINELDYIIEKMDQDLNSYHQRKIDNYFEDGNIIEDEDFITIMSLDRDTFIEKRKSLSFRLKIFDRIKNTGNIVEGN